MNVNLDFASDPSQSTWVPPREQTCVEIQEDLNEAAETSADASARAEALAEAQRQLLKLCTSTNPSSAYEEFLNTWRDPNRASCIQPNVLAWLQAKEPFATAINNGREHIIPTLAAYGLKPERADMWAALDVVKNSGSRKPLEILLANGWDIDEPINENATSILGYFVVEDQTQLDWCLSLGASPNVTSAMGQNAMHRAAAYGSLETLKILQGQGGAIKGTDLIAHAALAHCNGSEDRLEIIQYLLDSGAPIDAYYMSHSERWNSPENSLFLTYGKQNALHFSITYNRISLAEFLLSRGADPTLKMFSLSTRLEEREPQELASLLGRDEFVVLLQRLDKT